MSRPSIAWAFTSAAAGLAKGLAYHRQEANTDDTNLKTRRSYAFWCLYIVEKSLCLRLGRASNLQDHDISLPRDQMPKISNSVVSQTWSEMMVLWVQFAYIQGQAYEQLYCPAALQLDIVERKMRAGDLSRRMVELEAGWSKVRMVHSFFIEA